LQARKPLSALRTFGAMLQLRVPGSDPSSDMASGVVVQVGAWTDDSDVLEQSTFVAAALHVPLADTLYIVSDDWMRKV